MNTHTPKKSARYLPSSCWVGAVALHADVDHHVAKDGKNERAEQRLGDLERAMPVRGLERGKARELLERGNDRRADQVAEPDDRQRFCIGRVVVEKIADLARKQVQSARADDKRPMVKKREPMTVFSTDRNTVPPKPMTIPARIAERKIFFMKYVPPNRVMASILP